MLDLAVYQGGYPRGLHHDGIFADVSATDWCSENYTYKVACMSAGSVGYTAEPDSASLSFMVDLYWYTSEQ